MKKTITLFLCLFMTFLLSVPSFAEVNTSNLSISSGACILAEPSTGKIIYEKNSKEKMYPASTTKIMTALLTLENCSLSDVVTVSHSAISSISASYATVYLNEGEMLTIEQLLNVLLVPSGNVVGNILAEHIAGSVDAFVELMNKKSLEIGCVNTHYTNPYGLHDENHYSCAYDLYLTTKEAMKYDVFRSIVSKTSYKLEPTNVYTKGDRVFYTTNDLIKPNSSKRADNYYYPNAIGVKTGFTSQAGDCLVSASSKDGLEFISVILKAGKTSNGLSARYVETKKLFNFAYENYSLRTVREANSIVKRITIKNGTKDTKNLDAISKDTVVALVDNDNLYSMIPFDIIINDNLKAPISKDDVIGQVTYTIDGIRYSTDLLASHDVNKSYFVFILIGFLIFAFIIFVLSIRIYFKRHRRSKKVRYKNYRI